MNEKVEGGNPNFHKGRSLKDCWREVWYGKGSNRGRALVRQIEEDQDFLSWVFSGDLFYTGLESHCIKE